MANACPDYQDFQIPNGRNGLWVPADRTNFSNLAQAKKLWGINQRFHIGAVLHTTEDRADDDEVTPSWFQDPAADVSMEAYADSDGDLYQMVRESDCAWGHGVRWGKNDRKPHPVIFDLDTMKSYNACLDGIEIEGKAATIATTFIIGGRQYELVAAWLAYKSAKWGWPLDDEHVLTHRQLNTRKTDPGDGFPYAQLLDRARAIQAAGSHQLPLKDADLKEQIQRMSDQLESLKRELAVERRQREALATELATSADALAKVLRA